MKREGNGRLPVPKSGGKRFAIVVARFHKDVADALLDGARRALHDCGVRDEDVNVYDVPGCFEIPLACRKIVENREVDAIVALGAVVKGATPHFDFVAGECVRGIMEVQLATGVPIGLGVLTTLTLEQARERAARARGDKGYEAAYAAALLTDMPSRFPRAGFRS